MRLDGVIDPLILSGEFETLCKNYNQERFPIGIYGLADSSRAFMLFSIFEKFDQTMLVLTGSDVEARNLYEDLQFFTPRAYYFPTKEVVFYNIEAVSGDLRWERLKVLKEIKASSKKIIVSSIENLAPYYCPIEYIEQSFFKLKLNDTLVTTDLAMKLTQSGYERVEIIDARGQFSIRGGIIDVFPPTSAVPFRIELFGDEIDSIRTFNLESQRSIERVTEIELFPAKEMILTNELVEKGITNIKKDLDKVLQVAKKRGDKELEEKILFLANRNIEHLKERWTFETIDSFLTYFYEKPSSFLDYFKDSMICIEDTDRSSGKLDSVYYEFSSNYKSYLEKGDILPGQGELLVTKEETLERLSLSKLFVLNSLVKSSKIFEPRASVHFNQLSLNSYQGKMDLLTDDIRDKKQKGFRTIILSGTRPRGERFVKTLAEYDIVATYKDTIQGIQEGEVVITFGNQLKGYEFPEYKLSIISDKDFFGETARKSAQKKKNVKGVGKISSFAELKPGDYVVHANHGIGVYKGIKQLEVENVKKDYLMVSYSEGDTLYVPVEQLDLIQKYIGSEGKSPKITKLGGSEWQKAKTKARNSINEIAQDLVKLYATREAVKGYSFSKDTTWQQQFEAEFPYEETPDQATAIDEIKLDMERNRPMDRLLCGDVGYGKTEVAMRAAFKSVMDGKQVAFLVPTTILAEQHYKTLKKRFTGFPVNIDMISRFRSATQQKETLKALKEGNVDVIIGTHKILGKTVQFKDLGLLIVDEEQRFGVTHKEKIKNAKKNIDVLTLSATPIPRTLNMSLTGVRSISVIETPPEERYPVQTYVVEYNDQLIRDAVLREINRKGQVFFVFNRVENIREIADSLAHLIPEARIIVAHGQMVEKELEEVMRAFMNQEYDILVSTTIIETGIDIQNANTMIIYDSDKMGLSQLYQLRGRVGRTNRIAYAYLTYRKDKIITEVAKKRLKAIKDFTELGSGFKVALRDLEIRGAGNVMGSAQHGQMAAIGYDLYCKMLEDTIKVIKGEIEREPIETVIEMKVNAFIPNGYISDETQKIEIYKKIASIESKKDLMDTTDELIDRFSDLPPSVNNLMGISYIRVLAKNLGIIEVKDKIKEIHLIFENKDKITKEMVNAIIDKYSKNIMFKQEETPIMIFQLKEIKREEILTKLKHFLEYIGDTIVN